MLLSQGGCDRLMGKGPATAPAAAANAAPVTAAAAFSRDVPVYLDEIGKVVAMDSVAVVPQVAGKVISTQVEDGAYVKKGQLLFEIDPRPFEAALASAKASLAQNRADLDWAQADFKRTEELMSTNVVSQLEFEQKKSVLGVDQAKIDASQAAIQMAELSLEYARILAPIEGRAGARLVDPGNVVKANEGTMLVIQRLDPIYAEFTVTENDLGTVRKFMADHGMEVGNEANLGLKVEVDVPANSERVMATLTKAIAQPATAPAQKRAGTLTFMDNSIQAGSGTVKLRATVPNSDHYFWPGQFVNVRLVLTTQKNAVLIPAAAEQIGQQGPYVYVVGNDQTAQMRPIVPGQRQGDALVVEGGLAAGEQVITSGHMLVQPGSKVMVLPSAPPTTQMASSK
ncbi:MAG TPA: efflux RND transporter periplasmic adaptor subunit [Tepidisphaeraceae bacterium]|nr:efflux RND transporter periplasmic adaptor subunit [Tepidisphaeraceae bacterium]